MGTFQTTAFSTLSGGPVSRIGLGALPDQDPRCVGEAFQRGINLFFLYHLGFRHFVGALRKVLANHREEVFLATGTSERSESAVLADLAAVRKCFAVDQVDAFFAEYVAPADDPQSVFGPRGVLNVLAGAKRAGDLRYIGASVHDRDLALKLIESGKIDVLMHRYNMAHRKAAQRVLPAAVLRHVPVWAFTATRWGSLLQGHREWAGAPPTSAECYRYCLTHAAVAAVVAAPRNQQELDGPLAALDAGPLEASARSQWEEYGDLVYGDGTARFETQWP